MEQDGSSEELKKLEALKRKWMTKSPDDSDGSKTVPAEKQVIPLTLNQLLANWCRERFNNPLQTVEALRQGETLKEAAASLFWYCYSSQNNFRADREAILLKTLPRQVDNDYINNIYKEYNKFESFMSQLTEISEKFTLDNIKYPQGQDIEVEILVGGALIILLSRTNKWHKTTQEMIEKIYSCIEPLPGEEYESNIGMPSIEIKKSQDDVYILSGKVTDLLVLLACVIIRDALANLRSKQKDYRTAFVVSTGIVDFCRTTLRDTFNEANEIPEEIDCDFSIYLPYSGARSLDINYIQKIVNYSELVRKPSLEAEDWGEMERCLKLLVKGLKQDIHTTVNPGGVTLTFSETTVDELIVLLNEKISVCQFAIKNPGIPKFIDNIQREMRERTITRYFFPKGLQNYFENRTLKLVTEAEAAWWKRDFGTMAEKMRQVLEVETIATLPFLEFTERQNNHHLLATRIADAIKNNEQEVCTKIDSLPGIDKLAKKQLKNQLAGFIKVVVDVRNFFNKESYLHETQKQIVTRYTGKAEEIHRIFFGINCVGTLPFLISCKRDIKRNKSEEIKN